MKIVDFKRVNRGQDKMIERVIEEIKTKRCIVLVLGDDDIYDRWAFNGINSADAVFGLQWCIQKIIEEGTE